jgi:hypothetical protein
MGQTVKFSRSTIRRSISARSCPFSPVGHSLPPLSSAHLPPWNGSLPPPPPPSVLSYPGCSRRLPADRPCRGISNPPSLGSPVSSASPAVPARVRGREMEARLRHPNIFIQPSFFFARGECMGMLGHPGVVEGNQDRRAKGCWMLDVKHCGIGRARASRGRTRVGGWGRHWRWMHQVENPPRIRSPHPGDVSSPWNPFPQILHSSMWAGPYPMSPLNTTPPQKGRSRTGMDARMSVGARGRLPPAGCGGVVDARGAQPRAPCNYASRAVL